MLFHCEYLLLYCYCTKSYDIQFFPVISNSSFSFSFILTVCIFAVFLTIFSERCRYFVQRWSTVYPEIFPSAILVVNVFTIHLYFNVLFLTFCPIFVRLIFLQNINFHFSPFLCLTGAIVISCNSTTVSDYRALSYFLKFYQQGKFDVLTSPNWRPAYLPQFMLFPLFLNLLVHASQLSFKFVLR